jgi:DNA mismatch repair protein MutL
VVPVPPRIHRLSEELANQIAAGEVVERPASVVKELVENALDAGATRVAVDVEGGGSTLVRVSDDGHGMPPEDAVLALERHATSKIRTLEDLFRLGTFGFRGEALPSIASVSRLILRTRARGASEGCEIEVHGGRAPDGELRPRPAGCATGTTVEVRDLFFNVPARRKFLKATATESAHVGDVLLGAALARPDVTFTLKRDGRLVREYLRAPSRAERARATNAGESLAHVAFERGPLRIEAMLAPPERARTGATGLALLVNGRQVRDRILARAVANAYGSVLEGGRYPVGVVWIDLPSELVDVNVHPQKAEVRFTDARGVFDAVTRELHAALARAFGLPSLDEPGQSLPPSTRPSWSCPSHAGRPFRSPTRPPSQPRPDASTPKALEYAAEPPKTFCRPEPLPEGNLFTGTQWSCEAAPSTVHAIAETAALFAGEGVYARLRFVGQVHGTFLLCEGDDGLYVLDQHAAAERVTFDRLRRAYGSRAMTTQRLLVPELVELLPSEVALLEDHADEVGALGVEARAVGDTTVAVHAVPAMLKRAEPARIVRDLTAELSRAGGRAFRGSIDLVLATMACHGSIRAGDAVSAEEARALLDALDDVDFANHCPHGRPVVMRLAWGELGRRVGR